MKSVMIIIYCTTACNTFLTPRFSLEPQSQTFLVVTWQQKAIRGNYVRIGAQSTQCQVVGTYTFM